MDTTPASVAAAAVDRDEGASASPAVREDPMTISATCQSLPLPTKPATNVDTSNANTSTPTNALDANAPPLAGTDSSTTEPSSDVAHAVSRRRRGHRAASSVWRVLTRDASPHKAIASDCRHCGARVPHHHKSEKARAHLMRCTAFRQALADADARSDTEFPRPEWLLDADNVNAVRSSRRPTTSDDDLARLATHSAKRLKLTTPTSSSSASASTVVSSPDPQAVLDALAMFIYTTGASFATIDNPHLRRAIELATASSSSALLAPAPRAQDLTGPLLDRAFASVQCELLRVTQRAGAVNALCVNSWVPPARESVYLVGDATAATPLFIDAAPAPRGSNPSIDPSNGSIGPNDAASTASIAHVLFDRVARALPLCGDHIHGVVTDNSHANQLMWAKFKAIFPAKFFHGCAAHGLYLFVDAIFGPPTTTSTPLVFSDLRQLVLECREIVAWVHSDDAAPDVQARVATKLSSTPTATLAMPPLGTWLDLKAGFESVLVVLPLLQDVVASPTFTASGATNRQRLADVINRSDLEMLLFKAVALVDPLDVLMKRLERDAATPISDVFYWFAKELPVALSRVPGLTEDEAAFLLQLNQNRFNAMYGDSHGMAYLLDPRYVGEGLSADVRKNIEDLIFQAPLVEMTSEDTNAEEQKIAIAQQLTEYVIDATKEKAENSFRYTILIRNKKSVLQYWLADGMRWPLLQRLATRLFSLPASTLPMTKKVLAVPLQLPSEELTPAAKKKLRFIQLNQSLLKAANGGVHNNGAKE